MLGKLFGKVSDNAATSEQQAFLQLVQIGSDQEMAMSLAGAAIARHGLKSTNHTSQPFPDAVFLGEAPLSGSAMASLSVYNMELLKFRRAASQSGDPRQQLFAAGISVYVASFRALARPELFATGRLIWRELLRGRHGYLDAMAAAGTGVTPEESWSIFPAPNALAPGEA